MEKFYYGLKDWERLETDPDSVVERILEDACDEVGESFDAIASRIEWPIRIYVFKKRKISEVWVKRIADNALDNALVDLDDEYGDQDGDCTKPTDKMKEAAKVFVQSIASEYVPWQCETTGEVIEYTMERAKHEHGNIA